MVEVVAFDLDGTLSESDRFLLPIYRETLLALGIAPAPDEVLKNMIGGTAEDNFKIAMPERTMEEFVVWCDHVGALAAKAAAQYGRAYPGTLESLRLLRGRGYKIALCSNGTPAYAEGLLGALGLRGEIDYIQPAQAGVKKSALLAHIMEHYDTTRVVMVGDRHFDRTAARDNDIPFVGCGYGIYPAEIADADCVIAHAGELPAAIETLFSCDAASPM